jgi:hypothetical protein
MNSFSLIKMCLCETKYGKVFIDQYLSDALQTQNRLKKGDA